LQLQDYNNIFAGGDVIEWKEQKQAAKAGPHGTLIANNILALLGGRKMKEYKGAFEMIVATNGRVSSYSSLHR
jgi:NADH dehydrogenase FAD-containing subunit